MRIAADEHQAVRATAELEPVLALVEQRLAALHDALRERDADAIEQRASELHAALAGAVERFMAAARSGGVPQPLRQRLATASARVAAQREALARATAALDRAIDVLMPAPVNAAGLYGAHGTPEGKSGSGLLQA